MTRKKKKLSGVLKKTMVFFAVVFVFLRLADRYDAPRHENN